MRIELWTAHSEFDLAEVLRARNGPDESAARREHLYARALHRCETLGLTALAASDPRRERSRPLAGAAPRQASPSASSKWPRSVATGASNRDIADALVISERTAESHVQNILTKLGFGSRAQIASWYVGVQH